MITENKRLIAILAVVALLLLIPVVAMQFTDQVSWSSFDFLIAGGLLLGTGLICELVMRKVQTRKNRIVVIIAVLLAFVLIWIELAVGIFGSPLAGS
jgi:hypothetical protein